MKQIVVSINTPKGDEYRIRLCSLDGKYFSKEVYREILKNVDVITIELERIKGSLPTGHIVLAQIEEIIADTFLQHPNTVICFICDFLSPIPNTLESNNPITGNCKNLTIFKTSRYINALLILEFDV